MSALKAPTDCVLYARALFTYVDGELSADHTAEVEAHVVKCSACFDVVEQQRATRLSLRRVTYGASPPNGRHACDVKAPTSLRERMAACIAMEAARPAGESRHTPVEAHLPTLHDEREGGFLPRRLRAQRTGFAPSAMSALRALPLRQMSVFAVAGVAIAAFVSRVPLGQTVDNHLAASSSFLAPNLDEIIDDLVDMHASPLPPETTNPDELVRFDTYVGVPVRKPAEPTFQPLGGCYDGARMHTVRGRRAAMLLYSMKGGHRATMFVFNATNVPLQKSRLTPRVVRERPVYVGNVRGYSFAATERAGVGYALASDLDGDVSAKLMAAVQ